MNVTRFYYLEGALFLSFLVAVGLIVIRLIRPEDRVARRSTWAAAILFGSIAIMWGVSTVEIGLDKDTSHRRRRNHCSNFPDGGTSHQKSQIFDAIQ